MIARRLPTTWNQRHDAARGGLLAHGPNRVNQYRRAAVYVDKINKGAISVDLPIELPSLYDFVVNLKTSRALGLTPPPSVLAQVTEVIQ